MPFATPPSQPTVYQIGAVAHAPEMGPIFEAWARTTGLSAGERPCLERLDIRPKQGWPAVVGFMAASPAVWGAIVFEEKAQILAQGSGHFAEISADARLTGEINVIAAGANGLDAGNCGIAAARQSLAALLGTAYWQTHGAAELVVLGAGSRALALALAARELAPGDAPTRTAVVDPDMHGLERIRTALAATKSPGQQVETVLADPTLGHIPELARLGAGSVIVHAPRPGELTDGPPVGPGFVFPQGGIVWDLDLDPRSDFLRRAGDQARDRDLTLVSGGEHYRISLSLILAEIFRADPGAVASGQEV
ncbi:MAG: hypothetical protein O7A03_02650 [Alphaproteobacteria bacterium]|nr:hypothetical protein [Alphaproteobacteria bacterium]